MISEEQVIQEVLNGKAESFRWLIDRYQRPVFRLIFNMIRDHHGAEDATQDVFVAAYRKLSTFDPTRARFSTWLFTIARNKAINMLRGAKREIPVDLRDMPLVDNRSNQVRDSEFFEQMDKALDQLPPQQKRAFVLAEFEQLPYEEIAQIECVSIGTVKSRIHRAKRRLRHILDKPQSQ